MFCVPFCRVGCIVDGGPFFISLLWPFLPSNWLIKKRRMKFCNIFFRGLLECLNEGDSNESLS